MGTKINHNTVVPGFKSLKAIPIAGTVRVQIFSGHQLVGETTTKKNGEWESDIEVDDGNYIIQFDGKFRPIGENTTSRYATRVSTVTVPLVVETATIPLTLGSLSAVQAGTPKKNVFFGSDGKSWTFLPISESLVDLLSTQIIGGNKVFAAQTTFKDTVNVTNRITFGNTKNEFSTSSIPDGYIYISGPNSELTFEDSVAGARTLHSLTRLSFMSDVSNGNPLAGNILAGNGTHWSSTSPVVLGLITASDVQTITALKTFEAGISSLDVQFKKGTDAGSISLVDGKLTFIDKTGTYTLDKLGLLYLEDLCDVSDANPLNSNLLVANGTTWRSLSPDAAGLLTKTDDQEITGTKTFSGNLIINGPVSGTYVITDLNLASSEYLATSLSIKEYIDSHSSGTAADIVFNEVPVGSIDGVNVTFELAFAPTESDMLVFLNGQLQTRIDDYTVLGKIITFISPRIPKTNDKLLVTYRKAS